MTAALSTSVRNGERIASQAVPRLSMADFRHAVIDNVRDGARIAALFGHRGPNENTTRLFAVLADGNTGTLSLLSTDVVEKYSSLTPECPQAHWFEREIAEQCAVIPEGHPWLKPIRFQSSRPPGVTNFFQIEGEEIHEVAVGPVHAGVIEPGHFRFQCHGES
jgi:NADH:ubiquinone oxidoreductase subunit C